MLQKVKNNVYKIYIYTNEYITGISRRIAANLQMRLHERFQVLVE